MPTVNYNGDRVYFPNAVTTDEIQDVLGAMTASAKAVAEFGLMMGTASIAEPLSGLAGIATGNIDNIAKVQDALTYQPRTRAGQVAMKSIAKDVSNLANETGLNHLSGYWRDRVVPALQDNLGVISGSVLAAGGLGLITAMSEFVPGSRATRAMPSRQIGAVGDLGDSLPMDNASRMARADEMGFDTSQQYLHGASKGGYNDTADISAFDPEKIGDKWGQDRDGFFFTTDPNEANYYATTDSIGNNVDGGAVYPTYQRSEKQLVIDSLNDLDLAGEGKVAYWDGRYEELTKKAKEGGYDSIKLIDRGAYENKMDEMIVSLDPSNIRSVNAAFDPAKRSSSNLLAGTAAATPIAAALLNMQTDDNTQ